ncbi:MAG: division plane positioning ATPase MipZ [Pseudomonadota bacterium]
MSTEQQDHLPPHVIVIGNEKGGSGKSTLAIHLAVALLSEGFRVATLDLDGRQQTLTNYVRNRRKYALAKNTFLPTPEHQLLEQAEHESTRTNKWSDYEAFTRILTNLEKRADFIIIDTPSMHCPLTRLAHAAADTLVTPMNDSLLDLDVIARVTPETSAILGPSIYSETVQTARDERALDEAPALDWVVVCNRLVDAKAGVSKSVHAMLEKMGAQFGFRTVGTLSEHIIFRDYFDKGLTALDSIESFGANRPTVDHMASRSEILNILQSLNLPLDERSRRRMQAQMIWRQSANMPLELTEVLA